MNNTVGKHHPFITITILGALACSQPLAHSTTPGETPSVTTEMSATVGGLDESGGRNTPIASSVNDNHVFWVYLDPAGQLHIRHLNKSANTNVDTMLKNSSGQTWVAANDPYHMAPSVGVDAAGFVHVAAGMHHDRWQYWRSTNAFASDNTYTFMGVSGLKDTNSPNPTGCPPGHFITYPTFARDFWGNLYLAFRTWVIKTQNWSGGCLAGAVAQYNTTSKAWTMLGGPDYTPPAGEMPPGGKLSVLFHTVEYPGNAGVNGYQPYAMQMATDNTNRLIVSTMMYKTGDNHNPPNQTYPTYGLLASSNGLGSNGIRVFQNATYNAVSNANLPFTYANGVFSDGAPQRPLIRGTHDTTGTDFYCGMIYLQGSSINPTWFAEGMLNGSTCWRRCYSQAWQNMTSFSSRMQRNAAQGMGGGKFVTTIDYDSLSNGVKLQRNSDGGATDPLSYTIVSSSPQNYCNMDQHLNAGQATAAHPAVRISTTDVGLDPSQMGDSATRQVILVSFH